MLHTMSKMVLVTGGAGFVGSHLCERLVREGYHVISLDNYFTGSKENHVAGVEYREGHTKDIASLVPETPHLIYHLGEYSRVAKSLEEPALVFDLNVQGTFGVLEYWRVKGCKLVYAGSSTKSVGPRADGTTGRNLAPYTWMKASNTELVENYARWYNLPYAITYFYNVYGPRERSGVDAYGTVIETFIQARKHNTPCEVRSPGTQTRAFTHVLDTVEGLVLVGEKGQGDEYGISAQETFSLLEVVDLLGAQSTVLPATLTTRSDAGTVDTANVEALGWKQQYTLPAYIAEVLKTI